MSVFYAKRPIFASKTLVAIGALESLPNVFGRKRGETLIAKLMKKLLPRRKEVPVTVAVAARVMEGQFCSLQAMCALLSLDPHADIFAPLRTVHFSERTLKQAKRDGAIIFPVIASTLTLHKKGFWHHEGEEVAPHLQHASIYVGSLRTPRWCLMRPDGQTHQSAVLNHQRGPVGHYVPDAREVLNAHAAWIAMGHRATFVQGATYTQSIVAETYRMLFTRASKRQLLLKLVPQYQYGTFTLPHAWRPIQQPA
jgi:hypothetical protein